MHTLMTSSNFVQLLYVVCAWKKQMIPTLLFQVSRTEGSGLLLLPNFHGQKGQGWSSHHTAAPGVVFHQQ